MSWLSKATGIHIGGGWGISKALDRGWSGIGGKVLLGTMKDSVLDRAKSLLRGDVKGAMSGVTKDQIAADTASRIAAARLAAHNAEVDQLAQSALGSVALRRRKGAAATMFTGTPGLMGANPVPTGKTLLSQ